MIKYLLVNLKMILGKKSWANYDTVVVQIYPASSELQDFVFLVED
jgi:hypothetical protein